MFGRGCTDAYLNNLINHICNYAPCFALYLISVVPLFSILISLPELSGRRTDMDACYEVMKNKELCALTLKPNGINSNSTHFSHLLMIYDFSHTSARACLSTCMINICFLARLPLPVLKSCKLYRRNNYF